MSDVFLYPGAAPSSDVKLLSVGTPSVQRLTQEVVEVVHGGVANIQVTQEVIEAVHGGTPYIYGTQYVIEVVFSRSSGRAWAVFI